MFAKGDGVGQDYEETSMWFRKAAEQGHTSAQYKLGLMFLHGKGVGQDYKEAEMWLRKAAEQGDAAAQNSLDLVVTLDLTGGAGL